MTEVSEPQAKQEPEERLKVNLSQLRVGLLVGLDQQNNIIVSDVGREKGNYMELLGLAETAVDLVKYYRNHQVPSLSQDLKKLVPQLMAFSKAGGCQCKGEPD